MPSLTKKIITFLSIIGLAAMLSACESGSSTTGGGTSEARTINLDGKTSKPTDTDDSGVSSEEITADTTATEIETVPQNGNRQDVALTFTQSVQTCADCGIWFDSMQLVVEHSKGTFTANGGSMLVKKSSGKSGTFRAKTSSIPAGATIQKATLYMRLNTHEGIANSDYSSVLSVKDGGKLVRTITARGDIKGRGYSKSNPNVPIDFTAYVKGL